jgi:protein-tyrosine phosphatase
VVVSLVDDREMEFYGAYGLRAAVREAGLRSLHLPLVDTQPPEDLFSARNLCAQILGWLGEGEHTLIHCIGGWGRSGTVAASLLTHQGYEPAAAIALVRQARNPRCVESRAQEAFVHDYATAEREYRRYYFVTRRAQLRELLTGPKAARRLRQRLVPLHALLGADQLPAHGALAGMQSSMKSENPSGGPMPQDLIVLSGELHKSGTAGLLGEAGGSDYPVDRALSPFAGALRPIALSDLI